MSKLSLKFLKDNGVCDDAYAWTENTFQENFATSEFLDWDYGRSKLIIYCEENPNLTIGWVEWFDKLKNSEAFVRFNGKEFIMGSYQVFNPITGQHIDCQTEDEMKIAVKEVAQQILDAQAITVCQSLTNELGDSTWAKIEIQKPYELILKT